MHRPLYSKGLQSRTTWTHLYLHSSFWRTTYYVMWLISLSLPKYQGGGQLDRRRARGGLNPCAREPQAWTGRFLRGKLMSDHGHFSSYEGHKERRTVKIRGAFSRMHRTLDGWMLARAPASPAQGLHHHGPRYFIFSISVQCVALRNLDLLIKTGWSLSFPFFLLRTLVVGRRQHSGAIEVALDME